MTESFSCTNTADSFSSFMEITVLLIKTEGFIKFWPYLLEKVVTSTWTSQSE